MKTLSQVLKRKEDLIKIGTGANEKEKNRCRKELRTLRLIALYLEHAPKQESLERQLSQAVTSKARIELEFESTFPSGIDAKTRSSWLKANGVKDINNQIKILSYILGSED